MSTIKSYPDLDVWDAAVDLAVFTYEVTDTYPRCELFGLTAHTRKTCVSIPSNIAEGHPLAKPSYVNHLLVAKGGCGELDTQFEIAGRLRFVKPPEWTTAQKKITRITQMLNGLLRSLGQEW